MPIYGKIYRNRGGRWFIRLPGGIDIYNDKNHQSFYSRQHAEYTSGEIWKEVQKGEFDPAFYSKRQKSVLSFSVYVKQWLELCEKRYQTGKLSGPHLRHLKQYERDYFTPFFGATNILDIGPAQIEDFWLSDLLREKGPKTQWNIMAALHKLFTDAKRRKVIAQIPDWPEDMRKSDIPDPQWTWCDEETQARIFAELEPDALFFIMFQATHATRTGETRALQHQDIDLKNDQVTIRRAFSENEPEPKHTKTKRIRVLPLHPDWRALYLDRPRVLDRTAFVFQKDGKPYEANHMWSQWTRACQCAGVAGVSLYAGTRHSLASQAANAGVSLLLIQLFLGHTDNRTTQRYAHLRTQALKAVQRASVVEIKKVKER